jgi:hypothetical protein
MSPKNATNNAMPSLFITRNINAALCVLLLSGCAPYHSHWHGYPRSHYNDPYAQSDIDELLQFGATMSRISPSSRAETCRILLKRQKDSPTPIAGVQIHLMLGRLFSESCGDIPKILQGVDSIPSRQLYDEQTQQLIAINREALKQLDAQPRKTVFLERKNKTIAEPEAQAVPGSAKDENLLLREKLEAIRSMEKKMDRSSETN